MQGPHVQQLQALAQRVQRRQPGQPGQCLIHLALGQQQFGPQFPGGQPQFAEPVPLGRGERPVQSVQRGAPPQVQRGAHRDQRSPGLAAVRAHPGLAAQPGEPADIAGVLVQPERVTRARGQQHLPRRPPDPAGVEHPAQSGHAGVQPGLGGACRRRAPHALDQLVPGDHLSGPQGQHGEHRPPAGRAQVQFPAVPPGADRSQQLRPDPGRDRTSRHQSPLLCSDHAVIKGLRRIRAQTVPQVVRIGTPWKVVMKTSDPYCVCV
ncbi:hypothetical protein HNR67_005801 [Crossiella cryophila]|uniref:Uncharacterized protein n=1 Tax=Crossiella cryophila TaxID=43355 RepID=A0A7W7CH69_9PSEU|nr:hypothetical protein [Crossiella cryophila]